MNPTLRDRSRANENNLDFIRFVLAASVCFTHSFNILYGDGTDPLGVATKGAIGLGGSAVDMFFVISGFLITRSWLHSRGVADFITKRVLRIYPAFLVATLLCGIVFGPLGAQSARPYFAAFDPLHFMSNAFRLDLPAIPDTLVDAHFPKTINGSLWTIKYEFLCYLSVPLLALIGVLRFRFVALALFIASLVVLALQLTPSFAIPTALGDSKVWPRFAAYFLAGMVFYLFRDRIAHSRWVLVTAMLLAPVVILWGRLPHVAMPLFGAYILFYVAFSRTLDLRRFGKYGDFSYGVYLYAFPIQQLLAFYFGAKFNGLSMFAVSLAISVLFAAASWHLVEAPSLRLKGRAAPRESGAPATIASCSIERGA